MTVITNLRQQGKSNLQKMWIEFKRKHIIDDEPRHPNPTVRFYCIHKYPEEAVYVTSGYDEGWRTGNEFELSYDKVMYANVVWGERANGERYCYKHRELDTIARKELTISDSEFLMIVLKAKNASDCNAQ